MATVYKVRHQTLGSEHAMKVLVSGTASIRDRMIQEGRVQANLHHPNVVQVTDVDEYNDAPILVMEFVDGPDLHTYLSEHGRLEIGSAVHLFRGIVRGVRAAHQAGIVHRDLKPANVLLAKGPHGMVPKIADFGLVKVVREETEKDGPTTRAGAAMGTPEFMAPEQIRDASTVDSRADLFSLGCLLYFLVCGQPPFTHRTMVKVFNAVLAGDYRPVSDVLPGAPPALDEVIAALLTVDVDERVQDCDALMTMLQRNDLLVATGSTHLHPSHALAAARKASPRSWDSLHKSMVLVAETPPRTMYFSRALMLAPLAGALIGAAVTLSVPVDESLAHTAEVAPESLNETLKVEVEPPQAPEPPPMPEIAPKVEPEPEPVSKAAPPALPQPSSEPAASTASVSVQGDATRVWLVAEGARHQLPTEVPPGQYQIVALYPQREPLEAGSITVMAGLPVSIACNSDTDTCNVH